MGQIPPLAPFNRDLPAVDCKLRLSFNHCRVGRLSLIIAPPHVPSVLYDDPLAPVLILSRATNFGGMPRIISRFDLCHCAPRKRDQRSLITPYDTAKLSAISLRDRSCTGTRVG